VRPRPRRRRRHFQVEASHYQVAPEEQPTDYRADDAEHNSAYESVAAVHELTGKPTSDQTEDDPGQDSHTHNCSFPSLNAARRLARAQSR
jgi:hypothetical protein